MLDLIKFIQNVGRFDTVRGDASTTLKPFTLVYSENGRGKTTLCAILRSLTAGDSAPILERRRLSGTTPPKAVLVQGNQDLSFDGSSWTAQGPEVVIFDDHFVDANICSGLNIEAAHRQNLHGLVVGEDGVRLQRRVQELTDAIAGHQSAIRDAERSLPDSTRGTLTVDAFCGLPRLDNLTEQAEEARKAVTVLKDAQRVQTTEVFQALGLPVLARESIAAALQASLSELEASALRAVSDHFATLGDRAEAWVSEGMKTASDSCPFCGQDLSGSTLISHYRAYFSEAYREHKSRIEKTREDMQASFGGDQLARFGRLLETARDRHRFWAKYVVLPDFTLDSAELAKVWADARDELLRLLDRKLAAPLDVISLGPEASGALYHYDEAATSVRELSSALLDANEALSRTKEQALHGNITAAEAQLARLEATARRYQPDIDAHCTAYLAAKAARATAERDKEQARESLREHRDRVFGRYQVAINRFLLKFNADFRIERLVPSDVKGVPSTSYEFVVNRHPIAIAQPKTPEPSFASALSAGDRNTLALAFFFASLHERVDQDPQSLAATIVVIDDPASSLDEGRAFSTVEEIRWLLGRAHQVVVLSHARPLLCQLWERASKDTTATLQIRDVAPESSTLLPWDAEAAAVTEYDRLHKLVREYASGSPGDPQKVAPALRVLLESFLRVSFVEQFSPGTMLGPFISAARQAARDGRPFISESSVTELDDLREYANQFHHNTSRSWQENLSNVNETQLKGFADRVIAFTRIARGVPASP